MTPYETPPIVNKPVPVETLYHVRGGSAHVRIWRPFEPVPGMQQLRWVRILSPGPILPR